MEQRKCEFRSGRLSNLRSSRSKKKRRASCVCCEKMRWVISVTRSRIQRRKARRHFESWKCTKIHALHGQCLAARKSSTFPASDLENCNYATCKWEMIKRLQWASAYFFTENIRHFFTTMSDHTQKKNQMFDQRDTGHLRVRMWYRPCTFSSGYA